MSRFTRGPAALLMAASVALAAAACGGDGGNGPSASFTVTVSPTTATLFSAAPDNTVPLDVTAKDGSGQVLGGGTLTFASGNTSVATVGADGVVTAVAPGTAQITASVTIDGATKSASATVTVQEAAAATTVRAPALVFSPGTVDVKSGGTVTWEIEDIHHTVTFSTAGSPADIPETTNASVSRVFPASGTYAYQCDFHAQMAGVVRVH